MTFEIPMSTLTSSLGGRLISSACGVRNTVVTMKKMSNRKATSTIGVMSIRIPMRRLGRRNALPFLLLVFRSGVSTAPTESHLPDGLVPATAEGPAGGFELGHDVETRSVRLLQRGHHVGHDAIRRVFVHL